MLLIRIFTKFSKLGGEGLKVVFNLNNLITAIFSLLLSEALETEVLYVGTEHGQYIKRKSRLSHQCTSSLIGKGHIKDQEETLLSVLGLFALPIGIGARGPQCTVKLIAAPAACHW